MIFSPGRVLVVSAVLVLASCSASAKRSTLDETAATLTHGEEGGEKNSYCSYLSQRLAGASVSTKMRTTLDSIYNRRCLGHVLAVPRPGPTADTYQGLCLGLVDEMSRASGVPGVVIAAVVHYESRGRPGARSRANCKGCGQLSPAVLRLYKITDPYDPRQNMRGTVAYLKYLYQKFDKVWARAIAAYNTGAGRIGRSGDLGEDIPNKRYVCEVYRRIPGWKARSVERSLGCGLAYIELRQAVAQPRQPSPLARPGGAAPAVDSTHPVLSRQWVHPLKAAVYPSRPSARYGARRTRGGKTKGRCKGGHCGIDIGDQGQAVYAILDGRVIKAARYDAPYSGKHLVLGHGPDQSVYCHLDRLAPGLKKGDRVKAGQLIGWVGRTGIKVSKAHLHLNILVGKTHVDPEPMLRKARIM